MIEQRNQTNKIPCYNFYDQSKKTYKLYNNPKWLDNLITYSPLIEIVRLILSNNSITDEQLQSFNKCILQKVQQLWLNCNKMTAKAIKIVKQRDWRGLKELSLYENNLQNEGVFAIFDCIIPTLTTLNLGWNRISNRPLNYTFSHSSSLSLLNLNLMNNDFGAHGTKMITKINMPLLTTLNLNQCNIGNTLNYLTKAQWPELVDLQLGFNGIGLDGFQFLAGSQWQKLTNLNLYFNLTPEIGCTNLILCKANQLFVQKINILGTSNKKMTFYATLLISKSKNQQDNMEEQPEQNADGDADADEDENDE